MAFDEARSGVAHSGNVYSGDFVQSWSVCINGVDRTRQVWSNDTTFSLTQGDEPDTMSGKARGFDIVEGHEIRVYNGGDGVGVPYFAGRILQPSPAAERFRDKPTHAFTATDHLWRMDQAARITGVYKSIGVNVLVRRILADYTEGGFVAGYLPSSLGDIDEMQFTNETVTDALSRIAKRVSGGALWSCSPEMVVSMWPISGDDPHVSGNALTVFDGDEHRSPRPSVDLTQIKTRVICEGAGAETVGVTPAGAASIAVTELGRYRSSGGAARAEQNVIAYTGKSAQTGPGNVTGVSGITRDIPDGTTLTIRAQADDAGAQAALAALIGGSGVAIDVISDGRLGVQECENRASTELAFWKSTLREFSYVVDDSVHVLPGRNVTINVTKPRAVSATLRIQRVQIQKRSTVAGSTIGLERIVTAAAVRQPSLTDVLEN